MKVSYFAFDIFDKSPTAGFVHTKEITDNLSNYVDLQLTLMPPKKDFLNPFIWSKDNVDYSRFTLWLKPYLIPALPMNLLSWYKVYQKTKEFKPDIIHERFHSPNPFGWRIAKRLGIHRILEVNSPYVEDSPYHGTLKKIIEKDRKVHFENCDVIITQTETLKQILEKVTDKPIYVVSNGVNTELFRPMTVDRTVVGLPEGIPVVCFSGSFQKWHGVYLIPEIIKRTNAWFLFIGNGKEFERMKGLGLRRTVFVNSVPYEQLPYYLNMADIFIAPFDSGQFKYFDKYGMFWNPMKMFEYLAIGKPIVYFDYPELYKIVGNHGFPAKVGDLDDFIDKLRMLIDNSGVCQLIGECARKKALEYSWDRKAEETIKVYDSVLSP